MRVRKGWSIRDLEILIEELEDFKSHRLISRDQEDVISEFITVAESVLNEYKAEHDRGDYSGTATKK